jgi:hypothetical protein
VNGRWTRSNVRDPLAPIPCKLLICGAPDTTQGGRHKTGHIDGPVFQLPCVIVMLRGDVMSGILVDAGCSFFQRVGL